MEHTLSYIIALAMEVYIEYALAENFCMDFFLLWSAKALSKNRAGAGRLAVASAAGAAFAVLFPLTGLSGPAAVAVKLLAGGAMCLAAGRYSRFAGYLKFALVFSALTFALGGGLIALFSLADISYATGGGVVLSSVPVGIPLAAALALAVTSKKLAARIRARVTGGLRCTIYAGQRHITLPAFFDSGNKLYRYGSPVCAIPREAAQKLVDLDRAERFISVGTVAGSRRLPLFTADRVEISGDGKKIILSGVLFCAGGHSRTAVLHPDLAEAN